MLANLALDNVGWVVGLSLIAVLSIKELLRAYGTNRFHRWMRAFDIATLPLLLIFGVAVLGRVMTVLVAP